MVMSVNHITIIGQKKRSVLTQKESRNGEIKIKFMSKNGIKNTTKRTKVKGILTLRSDQICREETKKYGIYDKNE